VLALVTHAVDVRRRDAIDARPDPPDDAAKALQDAHRLNQRCRWALLRQEE